MLSLGNNIKQLRKEMKLSQMELAEVIGVSQTSIAHYEAGTRQPTIDTLIELSGLFEEPIDRLVGNTITMSNKVSEMEEDEVVVNLVNALLSKKENEFMDLFDTYVKNRLNVKAIIENIFQRVLYKIGDLWEEGYITEADEHYATNVIRKVMNYINIEIDTPIRLKKSVSFTIGSEKHSLGMEMINTFLKSIGIDTLYLGADLPLRSIKKVISEYKPEFIFISITINEHYNSLITVLEKLSEELPSNVSIIVGGQGLTSSSDFEKFQNVHALRSISELSSFIEG